MCKPETVSIKYIEFGSVEWKSSNLISVNKILLKMYHLFVFVIYEFLIGTSPPT